jgi:antitoxin component YwqK of YwqJK toxin-antitoxin module
MEKIRNDKYKLVTEYYSNGIISAIKIVDDNGKSQGEGKYFYEYGKFWYRAFCKDGYFIGKVDDYNGYGEIFHVSFYSFIKKGDSISEQEYKKELFLLRLGEIKCPQLSIYLKDFGYEGEC